MTPSEEIRKAVKLLFQPGDTIEVRAFGANGSKRVGRFPLGWDLVRTIETENDAGRDTYYVLNPTSLAPVPMTDNGNGTKETDVPRRRWFLLDIDPLRPHKISTDAEYQSALVIAEKISAMFQEELNIRPVLASSGNGVHVLTPIDLPNDEASKRAIKIFQKTVSQRFSTPQATVECFADAARLVRAYYTLNRKGLETDTLKWRRSGILQTNDSEN